jgi:hypothetical protein
MSPGDGYPADRRHPDTGGDTIFIDFFSNLALWAVFGVLLVVLLIALVTRPAGPDVHHHHDL